MQLFTHQQEALDKTKNFDRVAYYLDMGLGKTFVGSEMDLIHIFLANEPPNGQPKKSA